MQIHAGAAAVGSCAGHSLAGRAVASEHADGFGRLEFGFHIHPFVGLQGEGGAGAAGLDHSAHDQVLARADQQVFVCAHADDVAADQQPIAAGVAGQIGQLGGIKSAEVAGLVEDAVLRFVAGRAGVRSVVGGVVGLAARLHAQVAAEGDQAADKHFLARSQRDRAVAAGDGGGGLRHVVLGAGLDVGTHVQRQHIG